MNQREKKIVIIGITAAIGIILILIALWLLSKENRFSTYHNKRTGFTIKYPATWSFEENKNNAAVIFYSPQENDLDFFQENVNVVVQDISGSPRKIGEYSKVAIEQMEAVFGENMTILESKPAYIAKQSGYVLDFLGKTPDSQLHYRSVWVIKDLTAYQITYTSLASQYELYYPKVKKMINSFRIE